MNTTDVEKKWTVNLGHLALDISVSNPDTLDMIPHYLKGAKISNRLVDVVNNLRVRLLTSKDLELSNAYDSITSNFADLLKDRISLIKSGSATRHVDVWSKEVSKTQGKLHLDFLEASAQFNDVYTECFLVAHHQLSSEIPNCVHDIEFLRSRIKTNFHLFNTLPNKNQEKITAVYNKLNEVLTGLIEDFKSEKFSLCKEKLSAIEKLSQTALDL